MAGDTRDLVSTSPRGLMPRATEPPDDGKPQKTYEVFQEPPNTNALPEATGSNTHTDVPTLGDVVKTVRLEDFKQVHTYPCVREALLNGIGGGFAIGGIRAVLGAPTFRACNWAVGTFCLVGIGSYEYCLANRRIERANLKRAVEIIDRKKAEQEAKMEAAREERSRLEEEVRKAEEAKRNRWKFW